MLESHRTLYRYVIFEYLRIFALSLSSLMLIYLVVLFFQKIDVFIKFKAPFYLIFKYLLFKIPEVLFQWTLPYGILLGTLLALGALSRNSEITAMKAGGISLYRITFPLLIFAFVVCLFSFLGNEYLVPYSNRKTQHVLSVQVRKEEPSFFKNYKIWYHSGDQVINIQLIDRKNRILKGLTLYQFNDQFRCVQRVDAKEVKWDAGKWRFFDGYVRDFDEKGYTRMTPFQEKEVPFKETWQSFQKVVRDTDEMSYTDLRNYIRKIRAAGYDATRYLADLYAKLSYPFLNVVMVLIGIPFALKTGRSGGVALSIGLSVMIGFSYGVIFYIFLSFGRSGILPPLLAAWTPTVIFGLTGVFTLMSIRQ
jgi:lipopolysaccharide export system permease protein